MCEHRLHLLCAHVGFSYGLTEYSSIIFWLLSLVTEMVSSLLGAKGWGKKKKRRLCLSQRKQETPPARRSNRDVTVSPGWSGTAPIPRQNLLCLLSPEQCQNTSQLLLTPFTDPAAPTCWYPGGQTQSWGWQTILSGLPWSGWSSLMLGSSRER